MSPPDPQLALDIVEGKVEVLGIDEIVTRLGVSRSTLERWVRNGKSKFFGGIPQAIPSVTGYHSAVFDSKANFPPPDIYIGPSPKWKKSTVVEWLLANSSN